MIREIEEKDYALITEYYREFDENEVKIFELDTFTKIYVYELDNKVVGFINYSIMYERAEINYIYVDKEYRKKDIASKLIEYMIDDCMTKRCDNITLEVSNQNQAGINLYKKYGFEEKAVRKNYYKNGDGILMMKELKYSEQRYLYFRY